MARTWMVLALLWAFRAFAHDDRADNCGCHYQYGLRHCHPSKKTSKCEAPVKAEREGHSPAPKGAVLEQLPRKRGGNRLAEQKL